MTKVFDREQFLASEKLGARQSLTPEGFLLCESVPIARTGMMIYGDGEIIAGEGEDMLTAGADGLIRVIRDDAEVFHPDTMASFLGKPVTDDHPGDTVTPENWRRHAIGATHNVRRGEGVYSDCLVADLLIQDKDAIQAVLDGKREVSCGYDADYDQTAPGQARQLNIIGNHVALVDRGRCGPRCAIGDRAMRTIDAAPKKKTFLDRLTAMLKASTGTLTADSVLALAKDAAKEDEEEDENKKTKDALAALKVTVDSMPAVIAAAIKDALGARDAGEDEDEDEDGPTEDEAPDGETEEEKKKRMEAKDKARQTRDAATVDAATMRDVIQTVRSAAEILAPGHQLSLPTTDSKPSRAKFTDSMCACKRKALDVSYRTEAGKAAIEPFLMGRAADFQRMPAKTVDAIFTGASVLMASRNNDAAARGIRPNVTRDDFGRAPITNDALNQKHTDFWAKNGGTAKPSVQ